jgi:hypothetical protein
MTSSGRDERDHSLQHLCIPQVQGRFLWDSMSRLESLQKKTTMETISLF